MASHNIMSLPFSQAVEKYRPPDGILVTFEGASNFTSDKTFDNTLVLLANLLGAGKFIKCHGAMMVRREKGEIWG